MKKNWNNNTERRKNLSNRIKGENNPMYGKTLKNAKKVLYDNVEYKSIAQAVDETGIHIRKLKKLGAIIL